MRAFKITKTAHEKIQGVKWHARKIVNTVSVQLRFIKSKVTYLGHGKDGWVYSLNGGIAEPVIVKRLSAFGRSHNKMTDRLIAVVNDYFGFSYVERHGRFLTVKERRLSNLEVDSLQDLTVVIGQMKKIQLFLLSRGLVFWDLGFSDKNYMQRKDGELVWVDYVGSGVLEIGCNDDFACKTKQRFLSGMVLLHILRWTLKDVEVIQIASKLRVAGTLTEKIEEEIGEKCKRIDIGILGLLDLNLLTAQGWDELERFVKKFSGKTIKRERADITSLRRSGNDTIVRGYQNFRVGSSIIEPLNEGHVFAKTDSKFQIIDHLFSEIGPNKSYCDIGSNLGLYCFLASVKYGWSSTGIDYNPDYLEVSNTISCRYEMGVEFKEEIFGNLDGNFDVVSLFAVIHHIFDRTEKFGSLEVIASRLDKITKEFCIIEFPTELDDKAKKWTKREAATSEYSEQKFIDSMQTYFPSYKRLEGVIATRPFFVFSKSDPL